MAELQLSIDEAETAKTAGDPFYSPANQRYLERINREVLEGKNVAYHDIVSPAVWAMQELQKATEGEAERLGLTSDDDVMALVKSLRG